MNMTREEQARLEADLLRALSKKAAALEALPHVLGVGIGSRSAPGEGAGRYVVKVFVDHLPRLREVGAFRRIPRTLLLELGERGRYEMPVVVEELGAQEMGQGMGMG